MEAKRVCGTDELEDRIGDEIITILYSRRRRRGRRRRKS